MLSPTTAAGRALAAITSGLGSVLARVKPLHPVGDLFDATVTVHGASPNTGVPFIDVAGEHRAVVRVSRAIGLPAAMPDIAGLALRLELADGGVADLLFASTGSGAVSRFLLTPRRPGRTGDLTSLLPYRAPTGPVVFRVRPAGERTYEMAWAAPTGAWRSFALLTLGARRHDPSYSFDPVVNTLPSLPQYRWVARLREPAYYAAREQSDRGISRGTSERRR